MSAEIAHWLQTTPKSTAVPTASDYVDASAVAELVRDAPASVAILDLRKQDFAGGKIRGALNIPAQSTTHSIADLYELFAAAGKTRIVVHCALSRDRATRVWGWLEDYKLQKAEGSKGPDVVILKDGFKAFKELPGAADLIDGE